MLTKDAEPVHETISNPDDLESLAAVLAVTGIGLAVSSALIESRSLKIATGGMSIASLVCSSVVGRKASRILDELETLEKLVESDC